jgi:hypothetical protein
LMDVIRKKDEIISHYAGLGQIGGCKRLQMQLEEFEITSFWSAIR